MGALEVGAGAVRGKVVANRAQVLENLLSLAGVSLLLLLSSHLKLLLK